MKVRGHTFVWRQMTPRWLTAGSIPSEEVAAILRDRIGAVMAHFKGKVFGWDVVSEATAADAPYGPRQTFWLEKLAPDYVDKAFRWAHEADPGAKLSTTTTTPTE
jgi:endo-1,4-beta-xylanase